MFYSHEILTSRQYGVATIWLVATMGDRSSARKVTRKAIQEVDVEKACDKIQHPGAPIALRLQGNLLYGVTRVYNQQCTYMLTDTQKIQSHLNMFASRFGDGHLDPEAGQTRPENLTIGNDPAFVPNSMLPKFDLESLVASQATNKTSSQMTPLESSQRSGSGSSGPRAFSIELDMDHSDLPGPRGSSLGLQGLSSARKAGEMADNRYPIHLNEDVDMAGAEDWGMEIDENGNIIEQSGLPFILQDDLELPPLPHAQSEHQAQTGVEQAEQQIQIDDQGDIVMMEEEPLPEAEAFPQVQRPGSTFPSDAASAPQAAAQRRNKQRTIHVDVETQITRAELRDWQTDYLQNCTKQKARHVTATQAKHNAIHLTFGLGIGNIGQSLGIPGMIHPLAHQFSGDSLYATLTGREIPEQGRGRRRSASVSTDREEEMGRRVRPRLDENDQDGQGQGLGSDGPFDLGPLLRDSPEVGREAQDPMPEHPSSALPWNRGSSAVPSSLHGPGSAQRGRKLTSSPLKNRGDEPDIVRFSDDMAEGFGNDGLDHGGGLPSDDTFEGLPVGEGRELNTQQENERLRTALDAEGRNFLSFIETTVREHGERREDDDVQRQRKWVAFDDVFLPRETPKHTAAQAFYQVLCLATRDQMSVQQDGTVGAIHGGIWLGIKLLPVT